MLGLDEFCEGGDKMEKIRFYSRVHIYHSSGVSSGYAGIDFLCPFSKTNKSKAHVIFHTNSMKQ